METIEKRVLEDQPIDIAGFTTNHIILGGQRPMPITTIVQQGIAGYQLPAPDNAPKTANLYRV